MTYFRHCYVDKVVRLVVLAKSNDKTERCKKQSVAQRLRLFGTGKVY